MLGKVKLENLTPMKITKFANTLPKKSNGRGGTLSPTTIGDIRRTLSAMLETAVQQGLMPNNPSKAAQWPSEECAPGKAATPEEMGRFLAALENERLVWKALFLLLATTGMRRGEAVGMDWDAVDLERGIISIRQSATTGSRGVELNTPKTKAGIRNVALVDSLGPLLKQLRMEQMKSRMFFGEKWENSGAVFANPETGARLNPDSVSTRFRKICARCSVNLHLHELRHSYVTAALHSGVSLADIARQVGHASTEVTARVYAHAFGDELTASKHISNLVQNALFEAR